MSTAPQVWRIPDPRTNEKVPTEAYLNRELSWLEFNQRVLFEAENPRNPFLERLKFCAIAGSNLDEFFMVRIASIHRQIAAGVNTLTSDGLSPQQNLNQVRVRAHQMMSEMQLTLNEILTGLRSRGLHLRQYSDLNVLERQKLTEYFRREIKPVLTPLAVDPSHPFPYISNLSLNLAVLLEGEDSTEFARVKVPVGVLPRVIFLPNPNEVMLLEEVIAAHLEELFRGRKVKEHYLFRVTRNTDYEIDEDEAEDLLATIEEGLRRRRFGAIVRLEISQDVPQHILDDLCKHLHIYPLDIYRLEGILGVSDLMMLAGHNSDLSYPDFSPHVPNLAGDHDVFHTLRDRDILLHHPYESFEGVLQFIEAAAQDPNVLAIKQTLYRTGGNPRLMAALKAAAESGKQVVALVELKARFDEERNIHWARTLEQHGVHVVYGLAGLKTHAKVTLVVRREPEGLRRYMHIGTGNYNPKTAALYTDLSLLTTDPRIGDDASELFNHLTGYAEASYERLTVAPHAMRNQFYSYIEREMEHAQAGRKAGIIIKMNSLTDPEMIAMLYRASQAGVSIQAVVRGICCLRAGVAGLSENIKVRSLLGRFLEHTRIYLFENDGDTVVMMGSADWMSRNLNRRVEVAVPLRDAKHIRYVRDMLQTELTDTRGAWELQPDGRYTKAKGRWNSAQRTFMLRHGHLAERES